MCYAIYQYEKANKEYMEGYNKNKKPLVLKYCDVNNLYN